MATFTLSGSGTHALSADTTGLQVTITAPSSIGGVGRSNPVAKYDQGLLRFSDGTSYWPPVPILGGPQFIPVPANATSIGYALLGGAEISVTEVIGGVVFFSGGTQSIETLSDVQVAGIADTQILAWDAATSKWKNVNQPSSGGGGRTPVLLLDTITTTDHSPLVALAANTWTDSGLSWTFTVTDNTALILAHISGNANDSTGGAMTGGSRLVLDPTGAATVYQLGGQGATNYANLLAGAQGLWIGPLSAAAHTLKLQFFDSAGGTVYLRSATYPTEHVRAQIVQFGT